MFAKLVTGGLTLIAFLIYMRIADALTLWMDVSPETNIIQLVIIVVFICPLSYATSVKLIEKIKSTDF